MEILVCIKQVPDDSVEISFNSETGKPALESVTQVVNAFDTYALEMATRMKELLGGEIVVVSIGDDSVKNSLKNCLAVGGDKAFLVKNDKAEELDSQGIAKVLVKAKDHIEDKLGVKFDMVFCGKEATDYATSQVGLMLADELKMPVVTNVVDVEIKDDKANIKQEIDEGYYVIETGVPCVVTVQKPNYEPRYPTIKTKMQARKKPIEEIEIDMDVVNPIEVIKVYAPVKRSGGVKIKAETPEEAVAEAMKMMVEAKVL
ncbi:electron transfer flavoprotein subunit beta/FixA family protein [Fusobacterium sp.]|uniref:electron transfer flavoprotein subunit beta/FixA family protein n=1 Tax=Fusobacterium sp. TaxID=68766 RepID=UPI00396CD3EA